MFARGHKNIFHVNKKVEKNILLKIVLAQTDKDFEVAKQLLIEYADSLGFHLRFQNFEEELANLPAYRYNPIQDAVFMELKLA